MKKDNKNKNYIIHPDVRLLLSGFILLAILAAGGARAEEPAVPPYAGEAVVEINGGIPFFSEEEQSLLPEQYYGELDDLGRCTGAYACIGPDTLPLDTRSSIANVEPTGWQTIPWGDSGETLYHRCHLIGYQLSGQNTNERNLITGTAYLNTTLMKPYEDMVAQYVSGTGNHVRYRVTPVFEGDNLLASGVLMEGQSVEDDRVSFCVFCYNIQPGCEIDYMTGLVLETDEEAAVQVREYVPDEANSDTESVDKMAPSTTEEIAAAAENNDEITYVANRNTRKFHYPYCDSVNDMKAKNRLDFTGSRDELTEMGYEPCKRCNP